VSCCILYGCCSRCGRAGWNTCWMAGGVDCAGDRCGVEEGRKVLPGRPLALLRLGWARGGPAYGPGRVMIVLPRRRGRRCERCTKRSCAP
jgi:hypothetical protein